MGRLAGACALLIALNAWICAKWAGLEFTDQRDSIEWVYLGLARHYFDYGAKVIWGNAQWFPWWYNGVPVENTYPPLVHVLTAGVHGVGQVSIGRAYHLVTAACFCLGPVALFGWTWRLTGKWLASLTVALGYSVFPICSWLMPTIARDLNWHYANNQRMSLLARYGEGPHLLSMVFLPLAWIAIDAALARPGWRRCAVAALAATLVAVSNILGLMALGWGALALVAAHGFGRAPVMIGIGVWAWAMGFRWLTPWFLADIQRNAPVVGGNFPMGWAQYGGLLLLALATVGLVLWLKRRAGAAFASAAGIALPMCAIPLLWEYTGFYLLPQPHRYHLEMDMWLWVLAGFALAKVGRWAVAPAVAPAAAIIVFAMVDGRGVDGKIAPLRFDETYLARVTREISRIDPEARLFAIGGPQFVSGIEKAQMQFGGGFSNGIRIPSHAAANYGVYANEKNYDDTRAWLVAMGIDLVLVAGPKSQDPFRDWKDPKKFDGKLKEVWREGDDALYAVERANQSLAHAMPLEYLVKATPLYFNGHPEILRYARALETAVSNGGTLEWLSPSQARIRVELREGNVVSTQIAYDSRWVARIEGRRVAMAEDGLGHLYLKPGREGMAEIDLRFRNPWWVQGIWIVAALGCVGAMLARGFSAKKYWGE